MWPRQPFQKGVIETPLNFVWEILSWMCNKFVQSRLPNYLASTLCFVSGNGTYGSHTTFRPSIRLGEFLLIGLLYTLHLAVPLYPQGIMIRPSSIMFNVPQQLEKNIFLVSRYRHSRNVENRQFRQLFRFNIWKYALTASLTEISCFIST